MEVLDPENGEVARKAGVIKLFKSSDFLPEVKSGKFDEADFSAIARSMKQLGQRANSTLLEDDVQSTVSLLEDKRDLALTYEANDIQIQHNEREIRWQKHLTSGLHTAATSALMTLGLILALWSEYVLQY